jgi:hypothetical protein
VQYWWAVQFTSLCTLDQISSANPGKNTIKDMCSIGGQYNSRPLAHGPNLICKRWQEHHQRHVQYWWAVQFTPPCTQTKSHLQALATTPSKETTSHSLSALAPVYNSGTPRGKKQGEAWLMKMAATTTSVVEECVDAPV